MLKDSDTGNILIVHEHQLLKVNAVGSLQVPTSDLNIDYMEENICSIVEFLN